MGYVGIHTRIKCRSLKPDSVNDSYHLTPSKQNALFIKATSNNISANGMPPAFQFDTFPTALQNAIGQGAKLDVRLAKRFVREKPSKKVQFLLPNNDDMMKKLYVMAWKYMNYDADEFSSV